MPDPMGGLIDLLMTANGGSLEEFADSIGDLYPEMEKYGVESAARYMKDRLNQYVQAAPYNYVSYEMIGGFVSPAQQRLVMARISEGSIKIPYPRSSKDHYKTVGVGEHMQVVSDDVSMYYSMHDEGQARMQMLRGWDKVGFLLMAWSGDIVKAFQLGVTDAIHQKNIETTGDLSSTAP